MQLLHRIALFIVQCQCQMIALLVSGQPTLALEIPGNTFTDRGYQRVELFARGGVDPMKSQLTITPGRKDTINKQHMKMQVQIQCRAKALDQCHRTCMSLRYLEACLVDQVRRELQDANIRWPRQLNLLSSLASFSEKINDRDSLATAVDTLNDLLPDDPQVRQWRQQLGQ